MSAHTLLRMIFGTKTRSFASVVLLAGSMWLMFGCGTRHVSGGEAGAEVTAKRLPSSLPAEAYVFNSRLRRDGKPTTVKLELYHADTVIGMAGRAYLGKGALKGRLTADSLCVYFPASNEYVTEALGELATQSDCPIPLTQLHLLDLFRSTPDSMDLPSEVTVTADYRNGKRPVFMLSAEGCPWQVELEYERRDEGFRPRRLEFHDGDRISLKAELERFKGNAQVPSDRFQATIPSEALRIRP